jgi:hypothetical protein
MDDGNGLTDPTHGKMHDGNIQRAHLVKKKKQVGIGRQCPLHHICFCFDITLIIFYILKVFFKNKFYFIF